MIDKISLNAPVGNTAATTAVQKSGGGGFADLLAKALDSVDGAQADAATSANKFQLGDPQVSLEDAMISMQKANVSFQAAVQVRNRLVSSYHDIMNMQV
ncbi:MAG TPA: flagellar hook-basal body complex protein FliE [Burkholderiales bacterium]|jgi:flagellar hook-basal body complex protein FliE|nr:flagellar hook-basal body complex protein FliE [Burkholderiales bacterium]